MMTCDNEIWKDVAGFEGLYKVSSLGNIISVRSGKLLVPERTRTGYLRVTLCGASQKRLLVHRIVAEAFVPNKGGFMQVNHLDMNTLNNMASNLEWCNNMYNKTYSAGKAVCQIMNGVVVNTFVSMQEAYRSTGVRAGNICAACRGYARTAGGYTWKYAEEMTT